eukprot:UN31718
MIKTTTIQPTQQMFYNLLECANKSPDDLKFKNAATIFSMMKKFNIEQNLKTFNMLLSTTNAKECRLMWNKLKENFTPDKYSYGIMVNTLAKAGDAEGFHEIWKEIEENEIEEDRLF